MLSTQASNLKPEDIQVVELVGLIKIAYILQSFRPCFYGKETSPRDTQL